MILVLTTLPTYKSAESLASKLLESRLAACVSILRIESSFYMWKGKTVRSPEILLLVKTRKTLWKKLEPFIKKNHPHSCPEIIAFPASKVNKEYKKWLYSETS